MPEACRVALRPRLAGEQRVLPDFSSCFPGRLQVCDGCPSMQQCHMPPTALYCCCSAACRFVQRPNWVDLGAGEAALRSAGRYSELVALYQVRPSGAAPVARGQ